MFSHLAARLQTSVACRTGTGVFNSRPWIKRPCLHAKVQHSRPKTRCPTVRSLGAQGFSALALGVFSHPLCERNGVSRAMRSPWDGLVLLAGCYTKLTIKLKKDERWRPGLRITQVAESVKVHGCRLQSKDDVDWFLQEEDGPLIYC
ncbi:hypothetical protein DFH09DRAFT_1082723 [Mycena vulgaris]|nr:hypothetical protein DFH09DRAFT_1082723 [Mycena vulgaris]